MPVNLEAPPGRARCGPDLSTGSHGVGTAAEEGTRATQWQSPWQVESRSGWWLLSLVSPRGPGPASGGFNIIMLPGPMIQLEVERRFRGP